MKPEDPQNSFTHQKFGTQESQIAMPHILADISQPAGDFKHLKKRYSPWRIMMFTIAGIALAEVIAMVFVYFIESWPYYLTVLADAGIMTVIIYPVLYFLMFKPLLGHIEERARFDSILQTRLRLINFAYVHTEIELLQTTLDEFETLTGSQIGFFHLLDMDQKTFRVQAWSTNALKLIPAQHSPDSHTHLGLIGVWTDCIQQRNVVVHNNYAKLHDSKELPKWHPGILREMAVPILRNGKIQAVLGLGNKAQEYNSGDLELVSTLADFVWDIIENKRAESALRESEQKFRTLADWTFDWEKWMDPNGKIVYTSPSCERITGYRPEEFISNPHLLEEIVHPEDRQTYKDHHLLLHDKTSGMKDIEYRIIDRSGSEHWIEHICRPLFSTDQQYLGRRVSNRDITLRKQNDEQLRQTNLELQKISAAEHKQRQFSDALAEAAGALNGSLELEEVLNTILVKIREVIAYSFANIALLEGDSFHIASQRSYTELREFQIGLKSRFLLENFPEMDMIRNSKKPVLFSNTELRPERELNEGFGWVRSFLSAPLLVNQQVIGFVNLFDDKPGFFTQEMCNHLVAFAAHAALAIQNAWLFEQTRAGNDRLQALSRRLVEIQEDERQYVARELHDESNQALTSLLVDMQLLEKYVSQPVMILMKIAEMERSLSEIMQNLHQVAIALRPAALDHLGLVAALSQQVEALGEKQGLKVSFKVVGINDRLPENIESVLYRIAQEALINVVRHAKASKVDVILTLRNGKLVLIVEDDGVGFDPQIFPSPAHLGIFGMRERAQMIDGNLIIESAPGKGTAIIVEV